MSVVRIIFIKYMPRVLYLHMYKYILTTDIGSKVTYFFSMYADFATAF